MKRLTAANVAPRARSLMNAIGWLKCGGRLVSLTGYWTRVALGGLLWRRKHPSYSILGGRRENHGSKVPTLGVIFFLFFFLMPVSEETRRDRRRVPAWFPKVSC